MRLSVAVVQSQLSREIIEDDLRESGFEVLRYEVGSDLIYASGVPKPNCILLFDPDSLHVVESIRDSCPDALLIVVVPPDQTGMASAATKLPRTEAFCRPYRSENVLRCIRAFEQLSQHRGDGVDRISDLRSRFALLSAREKQVMDMVVMGLLSKQIAFRLGISFRTVDNHRAHILQKTGARNSIELAQFHTLIQTGQPTAT